MNSRKEEKPEISLRKYNIGIPVDKGGNMNHLTIEDRKKISSGISHKQTCVSIAREIGCDPTTISKEIKRNRIISKEAQLGNKKILCKKLDRFPYVCLDCPCKYTTCTFTQLKYDAGLAQKKYEFKLHEYRKGINLTRDEHEELNAILKEGLKNKKSVYSIVHSSHIDISVPTVYRYINEKKLDITKMDLPYAVTYKKRRKKIKEYDYPNNKIDRSNRTYIDYLSYKKSHINEMTSQMDFLGSIKTDKKSLLVIIIPDLQFPILRIVENKNSQKVNQVFDDLENKLGYDKFNEIFPSILTDRDPCFSDITGIEFSKETGLQRTFIFYCDAFRSNQKANVENMNKQLRKFFPKKQSIDNFEQDRINEINRLIIEQPLFSLDCFSPKDAFIAVFGLDSYNRLFGK